ncbi:diaminopimelate epimerase [Methylophaga sp. 42_25_T18]|nr:diaminopimelate epimerase [Methylophaga sp. 42_25_T18]OUR86168.1 diaminopimelate epimerase [Methylophaga sp. 42_8_T64]
MLKFTKMHGLGNDFIVIDAINQQVELSIGQIQFLADRQFGIGCDQLLLVENASAHDVDFRYRIFNADGSEVEQCGNGVRCFARFVRDKAMTDKDTIAVETASGVIYPSLQADYDVRVDMGLPRFEPRKIPFNTEKLSITYSLPLAANEIVEVGALSMGNPHAVMLVDDADMADVARLGPMIESHEKFPERVNAGFMQIVSPEHVILRVYERGVGETKACGTGACAAVVSGIQRGLLTREVKVKLPGGELLIAWPDDESSVWMTGPATHVFDGEISWATIHSH